MKIGTKGEKHRKETPTMPRPRKEQEFLHCRLEKHIAEKLRRFSGETGITKTKAVENALEKYIKAYELPMTIQERCN